MNLYKVIKILAIVLSVVAAGIFLYVLIQGNEQVQATGQGVDWFIYIAYITLLIAILFVLLFVIQGILAGDPKKTLIPLAIFLVIIAISYGLADGNEVILNNGTVISAGESRWIGTGLYTFYAVAGIAIASMIYSEINKIRK